MKKRIIPLVLAASLGCGLLAGCQSSELRSYAEEQKGGSAQTSTSGTQMDYSDCAATYDADKVMFTVDGIDVTWAELFYWYVYDVSSMEQYYGAITDWKAKSAADDTKTNEEYVKDSALDTIKHYTAVEAQAKEKGVTLTDEDKASLESTWQQNVQNYGGGNEATFIAYLQKAYLSKDLYDHINEVNLLYNRLLSTMYGEDGSKLSQDQILQEAGKLGYVRVKNLLVSNKDKDGNALTGDALTAKKTLADKLDKELKGITDPAALEKRFDELVAQNGEDPGTQYYADGYTFIPGKGTMDTTFETAVSGLGENQVSDVVETDYGYHIALRLPLSADATVEIASDNTAKKLGYYVAQSLFNTEAETWTKDANVDYTRTYNKLSLAKVFKKAKAAAAESETPAASPSPSVSAAASPSPSVSAAA